TSGRPGVGRLTLPREPRTQPPPVILLFATRAPGQRLRGYEPRVLAWTELGYAVVQGDRQLHLTSPRDGEVDSDAEKARLQWAWDALDTLRRRGDVLDHRRVIVMGERGGGYAALRAAQLFPDRVRAVVAIEPHTDLDAWYGAGKGAPVTQPMLLMSVPPPSPRGMIERVKDLPRPSPQYMAAQAISADARRAGAPTEFRPLAVDHLRGYPRATAETYAQVERFLREIALRFEVEIGEPTVVDEAEGQ
ncbi:MAG TPA: hypothetical protein VHF69_08525, partial [Candidatus Synoicihabitans sp.]|nr:hypothetical protein [Candidatus Synoicihabitans sp.]